MHRVLWRILLGVLSCLALLPVGASTAADGPDATAQAAPKPLGRLVDIGGYRLHIHITGTGSPTVVLLSGMGDYSFVWSLVQPGVASFTRVCSYDRAGEAWSDLGPVPRTMRQEVYELHLLLERAALRPPFVLVGSSYGGLLARLYTDQYPDEVVGIVLVDSTHENTILSLGHMENGHFVAKLVRIRESSQGRPIPPIQTMQTSPPKPPTQEQVRGWEAFQKQMGPPRIEPPFDRLPPAIQQLELWARSHPKLAAESDSYMGEEFQALYEARKKVEHPLGDRPLISLRAGTQDWTPDPKLLATIGMTAEDWKKEAQAKSADLASLSSNSRWYVAAKSGHHIHLEDPPLVIWAIRRVVEAARHRSSL